MTRLLQQVAEYKLAILIGVFFSINALALAVIGALAGVDFWNRLTATQQVVIVATIVANWTNTQLAFFNKTLARIQADKNPIYTGDSTPPFKPSNPS